jgi:glycosyltransferase involved in cell wall biosynthesis
MQAIKARGIVLRCALLHCDPIQTRPKVSIITTVYDRLECLERCRASVCSLRFTDFEHIIVADAPPVPVLAELKKVLAIKSGGNRLILASLEQRRNDWGISPAAMGLSLMRGEYVCFLSDDNGYAPEHLDELVRTLDRDPNIGFVYSSCLYDGKWVLSQSRPVWGQIDLGQPLFRRELFDRYLSGALPFYEYGWDWRMIDIFLRNRVQWKHIDQPTFIFRLAKYPEFNSEAISREEKGNTR